MSVNAAQATIDNHEGNKYPIDKLTTIYRLCTALEVELTDVLPRIIALCDKSSPDAFISQGDKLSDKIKEELKKIIDDIK